MMAYPWRQQVSTAQAIETRLTPKWVIFAIVISVAGGVVGLLGSGVEEILHGDVLGPFVAGPFIEEILKPSGVYFLLAKWPHILKSRFFTAFLAALGGLTFGIIENFIYLHVYFPEHSHFMATFRWTAGLTLHTTASFIVGLGINHTLISAVKGEIPLFSANKRYFIAAIAMHSAFNITVTVLNNRFQ
jgi:hypothetical protein